jgi:hypothetical protein
MKELAQLTTLRAHLMLARRASLSTENSSIRVSLRGFHLRLGAARGTVAGNGGGKGLPALAIPSVGLAPQPCGLWPAQLSTDRWWRSNEIRAAMMS